MLIPFTKAHGTGNSFIIIYMSGGKLLHPSLPEFGPGFAVLTIPKLCKAHSADGLLILSKVKKFDFKMDYYNNDGTWETMCANGARCAGLFLYEKGLIEKEAKFITGDGEHEINILDNDNVELTIFPPEYTSDEIYFENGLSGFSINSGAKHFVIEIDINEYTYSELEELGRDIRHSVYFSPHGTNVNFVKKISQNTLSVITYEKGVEAIMQSCGSGSVAAAYHMQKKYNLSNKLTIQVPGGKLFINFLDDWKKVWLKGPAKITSTELENLDWNK